jgi:hypothetical protein
VTHFFGCWWLPVALTFLDFQAVRLGKAVPKRNLGTASTDRLSRRRLQDAMAVEQSGAYAPSNSDDPVHYTNDENEIAAISKAEAAHRDNESGECKHDEIHGDEFESSSTDSSDRYNDTERLNKYRAADSFRLAKR